MKYNMNTIVPQTKRNYIGHQDKNGKDIYAGCIVRTNEENWIAEVVQTKDPKYPFICIDPLGGFNTACNWKAYEIIGDSQTYEWDKVKRKPIKNN